MNLDTSYRLKKALVLKRGTDFKNQVMGGIYSPNLNKRKPSRNKKEISIKNLMNKIL